MRHIYLGKDFLDKISGNNIEIRWNVEHYSFVKKGKVLCTVRYTSGNIVSPCDGYVYHESNPLWTKDDYSKKPFVSVFDSIQELFSYYYCCEGSELETDPYTGLSRIEWNNPLRRAIELNSWFSNSLRFSVDFYESKAVLCFYKKDKLQIGDCFSMLFDDGKIIDFPITKKPIKNHSYQASFILYQEDVETLLNSSLVSYRVSYKEESRQPEIVKMSTVGSFGYRPENSSEAIRAYVKNHIDTIKQLVPDYQLPCRMVSKTPVEYMFNWCYVYLMRDNTNGYHKIGISNKPEYREKTLQSEKPSIEMLACKKFPTRKIAEAIESALHTAYSQQRVRGEWFNLDDTDVAAIIETLK